VLTTKQFRNSPRIGAFFDFMVSETAPLLIGFLPFQRRAGIK
jgi:hypothetical protein